MDDRCLEALSLFEHRGGSRAFLTHLFDPNSSNAVQSRAAGFYRTNRLSEILDLWWKDGSGRRQIEEWIESKSVEAVEGIITKEMDALTHKLQKNIKDTNPEELLEFTLDSTIQPAIDEASLTTFCLIVHALQTDRAVQENKKKRPDTIAPVIMCQIAKHRSQNAQLFAIPFGLTLWAAGAPRQCIGMCSQIGLSISFSSLTDARIAVSERCMEKARTAAREEHLGHSYDNTQTSSSIFVEQTVDAPARVCVGTSMVLYGLRNASDAACLLQPIIDRRNHLEEITFHQDIRPSEATMARIHQHQVLHIVEVLFKYSSDFQLLAKNYQPSPFLQHAAHRPPPSHYKTQQYPLRTSTTAENTIDGNIEIWREVYEDQLRFDTSWEWAVTCVAGSDSARGVFHLGKY
ncbi:hypothetical protein DENSPDRAFT_788418 [Dentipellis sp. KUC8613]|nr:hypothetical protein DENSPDRAFT_788418 [Dentipellis sp. KUC8613]